MRKPASMKALETLGRVRLSEHFFMREMLYSEIASFHGIANIPDDPDLAIAAGTRLCEELLEPLHATFGHVTVRSAFRSVEVNTYGHDRVKQGYGCGETTWNFSRHVWDRRDAEGFMGATASIVIPWFIPRFVAGTPWPALAWWIHDHLPYSDMMFFGREGKELRVQPSLAREAGPPHRRVRPAPGPPHQARDGEPRGRPLLGVSRFPGAQALLTDRHFRPRMVAPCRATVGGAQGETTFRSGSPARQRSRLSANSSANRRGQPTMLSDACGVTMTFGSDQSGLSAGRGSVSNTSR